MNFEDLYNGNFTWLYLKTNSFCKNPFLAGELVQDTFFTAWKKYEALRNHENPRGFLTKVLYFKIREYNRARQRDIKFFTSLESLPPAGIAPSNSIPASALAILKTTRNAFTEREWYISEHFSLGGGSHSQIAEALDITPQASQKCLERARKKPEDLLPDY